MKTKPSLTEGPILRSLLTLSVPIILSNLLQSMYQITDTFWVGRLSAEAVAAVSLSFPVSFLFIALGGGLPLAGTVLVAQYRGRGDERGVNHTAMQTFLMVLVVSVVLSAVGYALAEPIMRFMGAAPDVLPGATLYLRVTFLGYLFVFAYFSFESLMRGLGEVKLPLMIVLTTVILNFFLDPLFIFGYGPVPAMGVAGAAMATLCTQAISALIGMVVLFRGTHGIHLKLRDCRPDWGFISAAFRIGLPSSVEQSMRALSMTVMTLLTASFGTLVVAAYGIGVRVTIVVIIPALGLSVATSTFVSQCMGAGKPERAEKVTLIGGLFSFAILTVTGALLFAFARFITVFFVPEGGEAIELAVTFIRIISLTFGFVGAQMVMTGTLRGAGLTKAAMIITIVAAWVIQFPIAYVLSKHTALGYEGIWWSFPSTNILATVIAFLWLMRGDWKKKDLLKEVELQRKVRDETVTEEGVTA